ncbi:MAG: imidazole glycerol phosphate synthase cyclase subunit [Pelagimonas sp.]|jgi:cyclase|nr:imidazole glycerol phosphate synthase cyclase subunit [Pelagimonas sp.]
MRNFRLIARLDVKMRNLIKGVQMEGWRKVGDPAEFARAYAAQGADELMFTDVVASLYERNSLHDILKAVASETFVPMTVGGGVRKLDDVSGLLACGADKVALNTAATRDPALISEISRTFGSQACVVAIETVYRDGDWQVMTDNGRNHTGLKALEWAKEVADRGAGEIILTAIHKEGLGKGMDLDLIGKVADMVTVPVVAGGGIGTTDHLRELTQGTSASAVAVAQALHWNKLSIADLRKTLDDQGIFTRPLEAA